MLYTDGTRKRKRLDDLWWVKPHLRKFHSREVDCSPKFCCWRAGNNSFWRATTSFLPMLQNMPWTTTHADYDQENKFVLVFVLILGSIKLSIQFCSAKDTLPWYGQWFSRTDDVSCTLPLCHPWGFCFSSSCPDLIFLLVICQLTKRCHDYGSRPRSKRYY